MRDVFEVLLNIFPFASLNRNFALPLHPNLYIECLVNLFKNKKMERNNNKVSVLFYALLHTILCLPLFRQTYWKQSKYQ